VHFAAFCLILRNRVIAAWSDVLLNFVDFHRAILAIYQHGVFNVKRIIEAIATGSYEEIINVKRIIDRLSKLEIISQNSLAKRFMFTSLVASFFSGVCYTSDFKESIYCFISFCIIILFKSFSQSSSDCIFCYFSDFGLFSIRLSAISFFCHRSRSFGTSLTFYRLGQISLLFMKQLCGYHQKIPTVLILLKLLV